MVFTHKIGSETHVDTSMAVYCIDASTMQLYWEEFLSEMDSELVSDIDHIRFNLVGFEGTIHFLNLNDLCGAFRVEFGNVNITYDAEYLLDSMEDVLAEARRLWYEEHPQ